MEEMRWLSGTGRDKTMAYTAQQPYHEIMAALGMMHAYASQSPAPPAQPDTETDHDGDSE